MSETYTPKLGQCPWCFVYFSRTHTCAIPAAWTRDTSVTARIDVMVERKRQTPPGTTPTT